MIKHAAEEALERRLGSMTKKLGTTQKRGHFGKHVEKSHLKEITKKLGE